MIGGEAFNDDYHHFLESKAIDVESLASTLKQKKITNDCLQIKSMETNLKENL